MILQNNPFYILNLSCNASRRETASAAEKMAFIIEPEACSDAQNELVNLSKRLAAEIGWFVDLDSESISRIRSCIEENKPISTDGLQSLSRINATVYNFALSDDTDPYEIGFSILDIDEQYSQLDTQAITQVINEKRAEAKLATVQEQDVILEIGKKREEIRQSITDRLSALDQDSYVELITILAEKYVENSDNKESIIISDVIDQYEVRMQSVLEDRTESIEKHIERIKQLANDDAVAGNIDPLIRRVIAWDKLAQPLQLKSQASGMPHEISEHLGSELRDLALYLHNERGLTKEALTLVDAMRDVFAELGSLLDRFESDSDALNDLLDGKNNAAEILEELDAIQSEAKKIVASPVYSTVSNINSFVSRVCRLDEKILEQNLDSETERKLREILCYTARKVAIELHNTNHQTGHAYTIASALASEFGDIPSLREKLNEEVTILDQQKRLASMSVTTPARTSYPSSNVPSHSTSSSSSTSNSGNHGCLITLFIIVGIFFLIAIVTSLSNSSSKSAKPSSTYKPSTSYSQSTSTPAPTKQVDTGAAKTLYYTVTFNRQGGTGGPYQVEVENGSDMPSATAPTKSGYIFKGYYSSTNGSGTKYYDENMKSVHKWDKDSGGTLYAYWEVKPETKFSSSVSAGEKVYADIVSIWPAFGVYAEGSTYYHHFVCECKTSSGSTVWVYMTCTEYKNNFDSSASTSTYSYYADEVTLSPAKRIRGTAKKAESIMSGLAKETGTMVMVFSSVG